MTWTMACTLQCTVNVQCTLTYIYYDMYHDVTTPVAIATAPYTDWSIKCRLFIGYPSGLLDHSHTHSRS